MPSPSAGSVTLQPLSVPLVEQVGPEVLKGVYGAQGVLGGHKVCSKARVRVEVHLNTSYSMGLPWAGFTL